jgi:hypothetical protein
MNPLLDAALEYHGRGWSIIPVTNEAGEKKPAIKWKPFQTLPAGPEQLRKWFRRDNITGIGVIFGGVSGGLASRDFDKAGAYEEWAQDHARLAISLPTVQTVRGYHVYFRADCEGFADLDDGEYRGNCGHYSVLPPSLHPSGVRYIWKHPLPKGNLPLVDPMAVGLLPEGNATESTERTENTEKTEITEAIASVHSVLSVAWTGELESTLPTIEGKRHRCVFTLARVLKGIPQYADAAADQLEPILREWHRRALPFISTKPFDETRIDFLVAWDRVKFPAGLGPLEALMQKATRSALPVAALRYDSDGVRRLAAICAALQAAAGDAVFFLSCRTAARVLGVPSHETAWRWLLLLKRDGLLIEAEPGRNSRAARFRWIGGQ